MGNKLQFFHRLRQLSCGLVLLACYSVVNATSVIEVTLDEMVLRSELVFEGEVIAVRAHELGNHGVQTRVTFRIIEIIKGTFPDAEITLGFLGGKVPGRQLTVSDMHVPKAGERGIYFVESVRRNLVNPLYGWSQGHLKLKRDAGGTDRIMTRAGNPVKGVQPAGLGRSGRLSSGVARGLMVDSMDDVAIDKYVFKRILRTMRQGMQ